MSFTRRASKIFALAASTFLLTVNMSHATVPAAEQSAKKVRAAVTAAKPAKKTSGKKRSARASVFDPKNPGFKSNAVLVVDEADSTVLFSRQADVAAPIASITKLMTAMVVLEAKLPLDEVIEITKDEQFPDKSLRSRLAIGTELTRGELLHLALMSSENRAAHALGRTYPGGVEAAVQAMNDKAEELGMTRSHFADTTGLSQENVASPADLSKLVIASSSHPIIRDYSTDSELTVRVGKQDVEFHSTNNLVMNPEWDISVQKTGFTNAAGQCLVMKAMIENRSVIIVLLNSIGKQTRVADARRVRRWMETTLGLPVQAAAAAVKAEAASTL